MAAPVVRLVFTDGHVEEARFNPRVMVELERKYGTDMPRIEATMFGAWVRLGRPGTFEEWIDSVEEIDERVESSVPTPPEASDGS